MKTLFTNAKNFLNRPASAAAETVPAPREGAELSFPGDYSIGNVANAIQKTHSYYLGQQRDEGYWWYELESNVTIVAEYMMLLHFIGIDGPARDEKIACHIIKHQQPDGSWPLYRGGPGDLSTTIEAYFALRLAGSSRNDERLVRARSFVLNRGGLEAARVFTKIYLALFGQFPWAAVPSIPVEINLFPSWFPLNIYNFSSWARSTVVPLSVVLELRPVRKPRSGLMLRELYRDPETIPSITSGSGSAHPWKKVFIALDTFMKSIHDLPVRPLKAKAMAWTERWILDHQEPAGDWGGIQPAMVNSVLALTALGYPASSGPVRKGIEALKRFSRESDRELTLQSCISPVWDTALTSLALLYSGTERTDPSLVRACSWLASKQIFRKGDWSVKRPRLEPGGWAFEFENNWYPDVDDTAVVLLLLKKYADKDVVVKRENLYKGLQWILGMQGSDGGWGAFDVDNDMRVLNQLLFGDLEAMIDPSTPDLTGRVLEVLGTFGFGMANETVRRAITFIKANQEPAGSWWGRWGVNHLYGTCTVLCGLESIGEDLSKPYIRKAVQWLKRTRNPDGGWGEDCGSYLAFPSNACAARSTPSQTAWALLALMAAGETTSPEVREGITYLVGQQREDGTWHEEAYTGTGFPKYFYLRYDNYRICFPLMALGRYQSRQIGKGYR